MTTLAIRAVVTRDVSNDEPNNYYGQNVYAGAEFYTFHGATYGCVNDIEGIALSEMPDMGPFFEFPRDAIRTVQSEVME
jgi:hypothetical protein